MRRARERIRACKREDREIPPVSAKIQDPYVLHCLYELLCAGNPCQLALPSHEAGFSFLQNANGRTTAGAGYGVAILHAWTEADQALWAGVLNFWFLGRVFDRVRS